MAINPILFSTQNRRMAFRQPLSNNEFSVLYQAQLIQCLNISIQGCQIEYNSDLAKETIATFQLRYGINVSSDIQAKIIRIENNKIALHFIRIESDIRTAIEEYLLEIQKNELRLKKEEKMKENEKILLRT
ncbi:PilZ domain-containing protein [Marinomonas sp. 2405UD68-3]|uniref:PilZ domain-containing protein n=1 Tax=Marinomonas sp. 2405UD68-3 TaxID=3391835 RepID=UPI0039C93CED